MKPVEFSFHARQQLIERGASQEEVVRAIREGKAENAKRGKLMYRLNVEYGKIWGDKYYRIKQVAPVVAEEDDRIVVVTVYTFFF